MTQSVQCLNSKERISIGLTSKKSIKRAELFNLKSSTKMIITGTLILDCTRDALFAL